MKGTIISGEEVLKIIASGDCENISKIYAICMDRLIQTGPIAELYLGSILKACHDENLIFIKIEK